MDKLKMQSRNIISDNILYIAERFPNVITETIGEDGKITRSIDFDKLHQELTADLVEGNEERYQFTWPGKRDAVRLANAPIDKTLRPCREESVDFDNTQNLYIEGDNLDVLKLLQENYLGKVKMIYIDPPYNTGNDFVYADDFGKTPEEFRGESGLFDEEGNLLTDRMIRNTEGNGRFHTDWLNMIYPRLKVARNLLSDDGVIFISIDDHEIENLRKVCDEIFGDVNCVAQLVWKNKYGAGGGTNAIAYVHEYILIYSKLPLESITCELSDELKASYNKKDEKFATRGGYTTQPLASTSKGARANLMYPIEHEGNTIYPPKGGRWVWSKEKFDKAYQNNEIVINKTSDGWSVRFKNYLIDENGETRKGTQLSMITNVFNQEGSKEFAELMEDKRIFDFPKPTSLLLQLLKLEINPRFDSDSIILDFFGGSSSTAHAVMRLNAENPNRRAKYILVQLPEKTEEGSEAFKSGYENICEIGKERIRRAGKKILEEQARKNAEAGLFANQDETPKVDVGFRVLKLDSSNMNEVYYTPAEFDVNSLFNENIKSDRTEEDLLFQVMLDLGIELSAKIEKSEIAGKTVWSVSDGYLLACIDENVNETAITAIAKKQPIYFVMRDSSLASDNVADNFDQIFEEYSKDTIRKIL